MKPLVTLRLQGDTASALRRPFELASPLLTVGAEEEQMLVRQDDGELASCAETVLEETRGDPRIVAEFRACQLEIVTRPCATVADLGRELATGRRALHEALPDGVTLLAAGTHPTAKAPGRVTRGERYHAIAADHPWAAEHMLTCGLHVHVCVAGADRALAIYNAIRSFLPELCALAANSPFHQGTDSGLASVRSELNRSLPRSGTPPAFETWDELARYVDWGVRGGTLPDPSYQWWALRLNAAVGTIELRVFDTQTEIADTVALAAVSQALVAWLLDRHDSGEPLPVHDRHLIDENLLLAARDATGGWLLDLETGRREATVDRIEDLLDRLEPFAEDLGSGHELARVAALAWFGPAERQRAYAKENGLPALSRWLSTLTRESPASTRAERLSDERTTDRFKPLAEA